MRHLLGALSLVHYTNGAAFPMQPATQWVSVGVSGCGCGCMHVRMGVGGYQGRAPVAPGPGWEPCWEPWCCERAHVRAVGRAHSSSTMVLGQRLGLDSRWCWGSGWEWGMPLRAVCHGLPWLLACVRVGGARGFWACGVRSALVAASWTRHCRVMWHLCPFNVEEFNVEPSPALPEPPAPCPLIRAA